MNQQIIKVTDKAQIIRVTSVAMHAGPRGKDGVDGADGADGLIATSEKESPEVVTGASPAFDFDLDVTAANEYLRHYIDTSALVAGDTLSVALIGFVDNGEVQSQVIVFKSGADAGFTLVMPAGFEAIVLNADKETWACWQTRDGGTTWRLVGQKEF